MGDKNVRLDVKGMALADGPRWLVQELTFSVGPGSVHMLLGERDTGKTAILEALAGRRKLERGTLLAPTPAALVPQPAGSAQIRVLDRLILHRQPKRMGMFIHWKQAREEAKALAARFALDGLLDVPVETLRPLERRLLELAASLAEQPALLLLDEPTSELGPHEARHFLATIRRVASEEKIPAVITSAFPRDATRIPTPKPSRSSGAGPSRSRSRRTNVPKERWWSAGRADSASGGPRADITRRGSLFFALKISCSAAAAARRRSPVSSSR